MIQATDEEIIERDLYTITQERQVNRTVCELMTAYRLHKKGELHTLTDSGVISARYSLRFFSDGHNDYNLNTDFAFQVDLDAEAHRPGCIWDFTDRTKTRDCVEHYLRKEIDATCERYGKRGYLYFKYAF